MAQLATHLDKGTIELLWPLRQLANLCDKTGTRYGYLQTEEEMMVCCFSKPADPNDKKRRQQFLLFLPFSACHRSCFAPETATSFPHPPLEHHDAERNN